MSRKTSSPRSAAKPPRSRAAGSAASAESRADPRRASRGAGPRSTAALTDVVLADIREQLTLGDLFFEKCTLDKSREAFEAAYRLARDHRDLHAAVEALTGLIRLANEDLDEPRVREAGAELERLLEGVAEADVPAMAWYNRAAIARQLKDNRHARRCFHRYLRALREEQVPERTARLLSREDGVARAWTMLGVNAFQSGRLRRAESICREILRRWGALSLKRVNGNVYLLLGKIAERREDLQGALENFQRAHAAFLAEHNWYYHLHVIYGYARVARAQQNYGQAYFHLDLMAQATAGPGFATMRREIQGERARLQQAAVDLLIDARRGVVQTRESGPISLGKQYVLLSILEELIRAHSRPGADSERGLSKAEIIRRVWNEPYRPEAHDNKLYYNINRLRRLLEPDMREPKYLQNWREGYRLAPGLRVQRVGGGGEAADGG
jgi:tetratricopeptide (TPR) repeat protein